MKQIFHDQSVLVLAVAKNLHVTVFEGHTDLGNFNMKGVFFSIKF